MRYFIFDTNFLLIHLRDSTKLKAVIEDHRLEENDAVKLISVVTVAEIYTIARRNGWGEKLQKSLEQFLFNFIIVDISSEDKDLMQAYVEIELISQSQGKKMGKNDVWIAATAKVAGATLITADRDFDHLNDHFIKTILFKTN